MLSFDPNEATREEVTSMDKAPFKRVNYYQGQMITEHDLRDEQRYHNEKRRLIDYCLHGSGVICGLEVTLTDDFLTIESGLALDCCGRWIYVPERRTGIKPPSEKDLYLLIEYDEYGSDPAPSTAEGEAKIYTRVTESFRLSWSSENPMIHHRAQNGRWKSCGEDHPILLTSVLL